METDYCDGHNRSLNYVYPEFITSASVVALHAPGGGVFVNQRTRDATLQGLPVTS